MTDDFDISRLNGGWRVVATSDRGKAFAAADPRFQSGKAVLDPAEALAMYQELHDKGYFPRVPDGLPPVGRKAIFPRLALLLALIVIPLLAFVLLV
jgi:hypothetical protein